MLKKMHAYLIIAHEDFDILKKTISILDDEEADFYIHIDKKVKKDYRNELNICAQKSDMTFVKSINVQWGAYSQIQAELLLLKEALKKKYSYLHLLSGIDMPLKTPSQINAFFLENMGKEFISIDDDEMQYYFDRVALYHLFQQTIGRNKGIFFQGLWFCNKYFLALQKKLHINRIKNRESFFYKGANWFSVTYEMARYVVDEMKTNNKLFHYTLCADEIFIQTIAMNSPYKDRIERDCLRYIDWKRGDPYTFTNDDFESLISSKKLFARKFNTKQDSVVTERLFTYLIQMKMENTQKD